MLAVDKAENLLAEYFKKFGDYALTGEETEKIGLLYMSNEMDNVCNLYTSHRLYVYQNCLSIFHRLFIDEGEKTDDGKEPIEDILENVQKIFDTYYLDSIYFHLKLVFEFLRLEYYNHYKVYRKAEKYYEEVNEQASQLLANYSLYTFTPQFLFNKLKRAVRLKCEKELYEENENLFIGYEQDKEDVPKQISYVTYRAICCYYVDKFDEAARWLNNLLNEVSLKKYPHAALEIKALLALMYCCKKDYDLFGQLLNSIQRQIRILSKDSCEDIVLFIKILRISISEAKKEKPAKIRHLVAKCEGMPQQRLFSPTRFIELDDRFVDILCS
jgi:hypothetical protein